MKPSPALLSTTATSCTANPCPRGGRPPSAQPPCAAAEPARALLLVVAAVPPVMPAAAPAAALVRATPAVMIHRLFIAKLLCPEADASAPTLRGAAVHRKN